jgi:hypothetical protein
MHTNYAIQIARKRFKNKKQVFVDFKHPTGKALCRFFFIQLRRFMIHFANEIIHVSIIDHVPHLEWFLVILEFQINLRMLNDTL